MNLLAAFPHRVGAEVCSGAFVLLVDHAAFVYCDGLTCSKAVVHCARLLQFGPLCCGPYIFSTYHVFFSFLGAGLCDRYAATFYF